MTGRADINIAFVGVGRPQRRGEALMVLTLDERASPQVQAEIEAMSDVHAVRLLELEEILEIGSLLCYHWYVHHNIQKDDNVP